MFIKFQMEIPFTGEEIRKFTNKLNNEKSASPDERDVELIKYASIELHNEIEMSAREPR